MHSTICYSFIFTLLIVVKVVSSNLTYDDCTKTDCIKCGPKGCMKCPNMIVYHLRNCVNACPSGYKPSWSTYAEYMGLLCSPTLKNKRFSSEISSVLAGVFFGIIISALTVLMVLLYIKIKRRHNFNGLESNSDIEESVERHREFMEQLKSFRPYTQTFLDMLNDTRRQVRELYIAGDNDAISAYRPIFRDLAKILILLNNPIDKHCIPEDWEHLFHWAQQTVKLYRRMSNLSGEPKVEQLINIRNSQLQKEDAKYSSVMSTFKPNQLMLSSNSLQDLIVEGFHSNYDQIQYSLISNNLPISEFNPSFLKSSNEYLSNSLLQDDFHQLGFRPQDEITTEL